MTTQTRTGADPLDELKTALCETLEESSYPVLVGLKCYYCGTPVLINIGPRDVRGQERRRTAYLCVACKKTSVRPAREGERRIIGRIVLGSEFPEYGLRGVYRE